MRSVAAILAFFAGFLWLAAAGEAASLRVAPTSVTLIAPDSASALSLRNDDDRPINVQIRVFRWTQANGADRLEPTRDVVASPPAIALKGGAATLVRLVRVSKTPVSGEESYRVIVDELPDPSRRRDGSVSLVLRYSIPVFFASPEASPAELGWSVGRREGGLDLIGTNSGERHVRLSALTVTDGGGKRASLGEGLAGYVLGGSNMRWLFAGGNALALSGRSVTVTAMSEAGQLNAIASPR